MAYSWIDLARLTQWTFVRCCIAFLSSFGGVRSTRFLKIAWEAERNHSFGATTIDCSRAQHLWRKILESDLHWLQDASHERISLAQGSSHKLTAKEALEYCWMARYFVSKPQWGIL